MGLDTVELVMEIEDEFGISLPDEDAERITTVGQTVEYVARVLAARRPAGPGVCPSARAFYRLRAALTSAYRLPRSAVRPAATVGQMFPPGASLDGWNAAVAACDLRPEPFRWTDPIAPRHPPRDMTVRELIATRSTGRSASDGRFASPDGSIDVRRVYEKVLDLVFEQTGVRRSEIGWDTRYIEDLGMG